jgi:hypothetical protein
MVSCLAVYRALLKTLCKTKQKIQSNICQCLDPRKEEIDAFERGVRKRRSHRLSLAISNASQPELENEIDRLDVCIFFFYSSFYRVV